VHKRQIVRRYDTPFSLSSYATTCHTWMGYLTLSNHLCLHKQLRRDDMPQLKPASKTPCHTSTALVFEPQD